MTAKNAADLTTEATTNLADNTSGDISAADVRGMVTNLIDSLANLTDLSANQAATGSGDFVLKTSPTLTTPALGVATATSLAIGGATLGSNGLAVTGHLLLEGVTSTGATGTGKLVFDTTPTLATPVLGVATATSINKVTITAPATGSTLTIQDGFTLTVSGSATISGTPATLGANTFTALQTITQASADAGIIASTGYSVTGSGATTMIDLAGTWNTSGNPVALKIAITNTASGATSKFVSFLAGAGGATEVFAIGKTGAITAPSITNASTLTLTGSARAVTIDGNGLLSDGGITDIGYSGSGNGNKWRGLYFLGPIGWAVDTGGVLDLYQTRRATATLQFGQADAASPVAQTLATQGSRAGTDTNVGGGSLTIQSGIGTGTGTPSNLVLNGIVGTTTGTGTQAVSAGLTIAGCATGQVPSVVIGAAAIATNATDGFLYIPSCAGPPTGTPTAYTGRVPIVWDSTNDKLYVFDTSWKGGTSPGAFT